MKEILLTEKDMVFLVYYISMDQTVNGLNQMSV